MNFQNKRVVLFSAALLASSLALAATPQASSKPAGTSGTSATVDCSKDKNGHKATAAQQKKCEDLHKSSGKY